MEHLKYFWAILLLGGTVIGFILALTNIHVPKGSKVSLDKDGKKQEVLEEKHRYGISFYMYYPVFVCIFSVIAFIVGRGQSIIDKIGDRYLLYVIVILAISLLCIVYILFSCAIMISIEAMVSYLIKALYKKRNIKVIKDTKYFNVDD